MNDITGPAQLEDGTYSYSRPAMWGKNDTVTATISGGQLVAGTLNGQAMTGHCWKGCTLDDLKCLPYSFERATLGKPRASRLHRIMARLGHADHYRAASAALGRPVDSLATLTEQEGRTVWNHARALRFAFEQTKETVEDALERTRWYALRWNIEDYHKCLKTGCRMEARQLRSADRLQRLLGFLAIVAVRLLWLRSMSRRDGDQLACQLIPEPLCQVIAYRVCQPEATLTLRAFWRAVANLGGFLGRKGYGDAGWQTLWKGWRRLLDLAWSTPSQTLSP